MEELTVTVKNYRCFTDEHPAVFRIGNGFTSFIGPNNSGKSSLLRLFYELRSLFSHFGSTLTENLSLGLNGNLQHIGVAGLTDSTEIFNDKTERPISITVSLAERRNRTAQKYMLSDLTFKCEKKAPSNWGLEGYVIQGPYENKTMGIPRGQVKRENPGVYAIPGGVMDSTLFQDSLSQLSRCLYVGPFRNAILEGSSNYYDLRIGTEFVKLWNAWQSGALKEHNKAIDEVVEVLQHIFGYTRLDIKAAEGVKTLKIQIGKQFYSLNEVGSGLTQFILAFGNAATARPSYVLIDEPETNLHPTLQIDFLLSLAKYAQHGVVFSTHSIGLARSVSDNMYALKRDGDDVICAPFEKFPRFSEFMGEMSYSSYQTLGFDRVLLVEGVTDVKTVMQFLRMYKKDHKVLILPMGGDALARPDVDLELAEIKRITPKVSALVDSERTSQATDPVPRRLEFLKLCKKLTIDAHATEYRAIENYLSDRAIKEVKGPKYRALSPFQLLKDMDPAWGKAENWQIARAMRKEEIQDTDLGKFIDTL